MGGYRVGILFRDSVFSVQLLSSRHFSSLSEAVDCIRKNVGYPLVDTINLLFQCSPQPETRLCGIVSLRISQIQSLEKCVLSLEQYSRYWGGSCTVDAGIGTIGGLRPNIYGEKVVFRWLHVKPLTFRKRHIGLHAQVGCSIRQLSVVQQYLFKHDYLFFFRLFNSSSDLRMCFTCSSLSNYFEHIDYFRLCLIACL